MPRPFAKISVLILSHAVVFALAATMTGGALVGAEFARARQTPMFRIGARLSDAAVAGKAAAPSLEGDLQSMDAELGAPTADVIRMGLLLRGRKLVEAGEVCRRLGWARCDPKALGEMREMVAR